MNLINLLPHQQEAIASIVKNAKTDRKRIAISMPPGTGSGVVLSGTIEALWDSGLIPKWKKILVIAPNKLIVLSLREVLKQHLNSALSINTDDDRNAIIRSNVSILPNSSLSLIDSQIFDGKTEIDVGLIIFIGLSALNKSVNKLIQINSKAIQILLNNSYEKDEYFGDYIYQYSINEAIRDRHFVPIEYRRVEIPQNLDYQEFSGTDINFNSKQRGISSEYIAQSARIIADESHNKKTIVYCPTVAVATSLADIINNIIGNGAHSSVISEKHEKSSRNHSVDSYMRSEGEPFVLCMVGPEIITSDLRPTQIVVILRPVRSVSFLQRMINPGLRVFPEKQSLLVLDFVGIEGILQQMLAGAPTVSDLSPEANLAENHDHYFSMSKVAFRDKRDIDGVLGVDILSDELAEILNIMPTEQGSMIGIFGKWGRGKTFLMEQTWQKLKEYNKFTKVDFHAWKYQDTPATWAYLYECLSDSYFEEGSQSKFFSRVTKTWRCIHLNLQRKGIWPIVKFIAIVLSGILVSVVIVKRPGSEAGMFNDLTSSLGVSTTVFITLYTLFLSAKKDYGAKAKDLYLKYSSKHSLKEHLGLQAEIQKETLTLLKTWIPKKKIGMKKLVVFVEDIDRCSEVKIVQIIDALRVLLEDPEIAERVIVVAAVDERMLKMTIKMKYRSLMDLGKEEEKNEIKLNQITREYFDKLFITGIKLGDLSTLDLDSFLIALTKKDRNDELLIPLERLMEEETQRDRERMNPGLLDAIDEHDREQANLRMEDSDEELDYETEFLESSKEVGPLKRTPEDNRDQPEMVSKILSMEELNILRISLTKYRNATPRQIRVFYFRYLIAKNLLIRQYAKLDRTNVWQTKRNCQILASLLVKYTVHEDSDILSKHINLAFNDRNDKQEVLLMHSIIADTVDYKELLKVLSIVVAY